MLLQEKNLMSNIREIRQKEFANKWIEGSRFSILNLCPRFGKIFCSINIFEILKPNSILISYPDEKIKNSWEEDFIKRNYNNENITFVTHLSLWKYKDEKFDIIVIDECHLLSENQIEICKELFKNNKQILALTGTLSSETRNCLKKELSLNVEALYPIELAIKEGVISNYEIEIIKVALDDKILQTFGKKKRTEKKQFNALTYVINQLEEEGKDTFFLRLKRMKIIQNSLAKLNKTKELIEKYKEERILVFCGAINIADRLGIPTYHSKSEDKQIFDNFVNGIGNQLAVIQIGNTGVTYLPLNRIIINYTSSNPEDLCQKIMRALSIEYNNIDKKAHIFIITSDENIELLWIKRALSFFDKNKIKYI